MNEKIKKQQTLFRFVSLRAPEKSDNENQEKRFVFHPDNTSGVFLANKNKIVNSENKWKELINTANSFDAFKTLNDLTKKHGNLYEISEWLVKNRASKSNEEIDTKTKNLQKLSSKDEINLWDNLFYQVITQKDFLH